MKWGHVIKHAPILLIIRNNPKNAYIFLSKDINLKTI